MHRLTTYFPTCLAMKEKHHLLQGNHIEELSQAYCRQSYYGILGKNERDNIQRYVSIKWLDIEKHQIRHQWNYSSTIMERVQLELPRVRGNNYARKGIKT